MLARTLQRSLKTQLLHTMSIPKTHSVILFEETGSVDVLQYRTDYPVPSIKPNQILVKNKYAGVNYIENYFRAGVYPSEKPYLLGREAAGEIVAVGDEVASYKVGEKIAYLGGSNFAQYTAVTPGPNKVLKVNNDSDMKQLAGAMLQGLTALTFLNEAYKVKKGDYILIYAAAGGVGLIMNQLLKLKGAHTIAVASTDEKLQLAKEYGAEFLVRSDEDVLARVLEITNGQGVDAVYDSVGKDTFETSFAALKRKGTFVSFGNASGPVPPFPIGRLSAKNITILRPQLFPYITTDEEFSHYSGELLRLIDSGELKIFISKTYPLSEYKQCAIDMEGRKTVGKLVLEIPQ